MRHIFTRMGQIFIIARSSVTGCLPSSAFFSAAMAATRLFARRQEAFTERILASRALGHPLGVGLRHFNFELSGHRNNQSVL